MSTTEIVRAAASSTAPAAVIHDISDLGERKKTSVASVVWLSSISANHVSHVRQYSPSLSSPWMRLKRSSIWTAEGGMPARTSSMLTACSRREKAEYMVGR